MGKGYTILKEGGFITLILFCRHSLNQKPNKPSMNLIERLRLTSPAVKQPKRPP